MHSLLSTTLSGFLVVVSCTRASIWVTGSDDIDIYEHKEIPALRTLLLSKSYGKSLGYASIGHLVRHLTISSWGKELYKLNYAVNLPRVASLLWFADGPSTISDYIFFSTILLSDTLKSLATSPLGERLLRYQPV